MNLPIRLENAITKLYTAFHEGTLDAMDSCGCAVGNMCDNTDDWTYSYNSNTGYSSTELRNIEKLFMHGLKPNTDQFDPESFVHCPKEYLEIDILGWDPFKVRTGLNNDLVFLALCAVVEYLCELDNIPNVMDYTKLFETDNDKPKYQLS